MSVMMVVLLLLIGTGPSKISSLVSPGASTTWKVSTPVSGGVAVAEIGKVFVGVRWVESFFFVPLLMFFSVFIYDGMY